jgi:amino acid transporter
MSDNSANEEALPRITNVGAMKRAIDVRGAVAINVITMIGIGPLVTIPLVIAALGGPLALLGWIAGAVVALCDGLVWAELSSRFPGSGGTYVYLRETFGPQRWGRALAFLFNWQFLLYAPCLLASGYIGFVNYAAYVYPPLTQPWAHDTATVLIGCITIALLYRRTSQVSALGAALAVAAILTIALVALAGLTHAAVAHPFAMAQPLRLGGGFLAGLGTALYITLYDYVGYADVALLGDEVIAPRRTIPLSILCSVVLVAALYILLQIGVLRGIGWQSLLDGHGQPTPQSQYVGALVVEQAWGRAAAIGITLLVLVTAFASLYGNLLGFSRISFAAARDGAFLPAFARLHPRKDIPHVALFAVGGLSLIASVFTLDQVIAFLTAGIVLVQSVAQIVALAILRARRDVAPFRMPLYPLPAIVALVGWLYAFASCGATAIVLGVGWLLAGTATFLVFARTKRWWPFAAALLFVCLVAQPARAAAPPGRVVTAPSWSNWHASRVVMQQGYPVFTVDGKPFFVYGAAFFYERIPRDRWGATLDSYRNLGINTIDLYCIWNWHLAPTNAGTRYDFNGSTDPQRDLVGLLQLIHARGFKVVLRPGPVIRNEWRNGGYPASLLELPEYHMPLHDVLEGRYPATATLQNAHADAAAAEWLGNNTHRTESSDWLRSVLHAVAPFSNDVIAIAVDDDQGAYLNNDTWPAPHWHAYIGWLRSVVAGVAGNKVPLFINTYDMKVPSASPAWAWGDWYQGGAYRIGASDLANLDFATGLLQTQRNVPVMQAEFQAGWLQGADEAEPRPSDPANTAIALAELLRDGASGIVSFPVQDTIYPHGWEAPWANWSYGWDAALTVDLRAAQRYAPTRAFGEVVSRYGSLLARTHVVADAAIVWPPSLFAQGSLNNNDFAQLASATAALQRACDARGLTCTMIDLANGVPHALLLPFDLQGRMARRMRTPSIALLHRLRSAGTLLDSPSSVRVSPRFAHPPNVTVRLADDGSYAFEAAINPSGVRRRIAAFDVRLARRIVRVASLDMPAYSSRVVPVGVWSAPKRLGPAPSPGTPPPFVVPDGTVIVNAHLRVVFAPFAGARIAELSANGINAATSIGLLRDAVEPEPPLSARDYIATYTHPLPAGTFNRKYACTRTDALGMQQVSCSYDAPDLPHSWGTFSRTLTLPNGSDALAVDETFTPHDARSTARLESISGFALQPGDIVLRSADRRAIGILHAGELAQLRWQTGDVARVELRATRGAELVSLVFARRHVHLMLTVAPARSRGEAQRLLDANQA